MIRACYIIILTLLTLALHTTAKAEGAFERGRYESLHMPEKSEDLGSLNPYQPPIIHPFHLTNLDETNRDTLTIHVEVDEGLNSQNSRWKIGESHHGVFYRRLQTIDEIKPEIESLRITDPAGPYQGLIIHIENYLHEPYEKIFVHRGKIRNQNGDVIALDTDRTFEYWLWGTNDSIENRTKAVNALPVVTYRQCVLLSNPIVETTPAQCVMPNQDIFLDIPENPTQDAIDTKSFDDCLYTGKALINTFPRRCIVSGGHVFTEPPRLRDAPKVQKKFVPSDFNLPTNTN